MQQHDHVEHCCHRRLVCLGEFFAHFGRLLLGIG
jgi:hypothetical protein